MMQLNKIFKTAPSLKIDGLALDSRKVQQNYIFFAIDGLEDDGHQYIDMAIKNGAVAIVHSKPVAFKRKKIVYIQCENVINVLNYVVKIFYNHPSSEMFVYSLTGTNGKTTTAKLIQEISNHFEKTGYIGTLGFDYGDVHINSSLTTPDAIELNQQIVNMKKAKITALAMEVSSHGLALSRVDSLHKDIAIFTNLTHDHLDFHHTFDNYLAAKLCLFKNFDGYSLLNIDDPYFDQFNEVSNVVLTYGKHKEADYRIVDVVCTSNQTQFMLEFENNQYLVQTKLLGEYNAYNLTAAIAALHLRGYDLQTIIQYANVVEGVEGRLNKIGNSSINIFVDYAHTPDGLQKVFEYAKSITDADHRIIAVFGSAGRRDVAKRIVFGEIADQYCDQIILTEDDPRDENIREIAQEIRKGIKNTPSLIIEDRYEAIRIAIDNASDNDTVVILGKGKEKYMYRGNKKEDYLGDDTIVLEILNKREKENELQ